MDIPPVLLLRARKLLVVGSKVDILHLELEVVLRSHLDGDLSLEGMSSIG